MLQPAPEKAGAYGRKLYDIVSGVQAELSKVAEAGAADAQKKFAALVESAAKNARPVPEQAVAMAKAAFAAANDAFGNAQKAASRLPRPPRPTSSSSAPPPSRRPSRAAPPGAHPRRSSHGASTPAPWRRPARAVAPGWPQRRRRLAGHARAARLLRRRADRALADLPGVDAEHLYLDVLRLGDDGRIDGSVSAPARRCRARSRWMHARASCAWWPNCCATPSMRAVARPAWARPSRCCARTVSRARSWPSRPSISTRPAAKTRWPPRSPTCSCSASAKREASATLDALLAHLLPHAVAGSELTDQVGLLVRRVGRAQARRRLREATDFELLPTPICSASSRAGIRRRCRA